MRQLTLMIICLALQTTSAIKNGWEKVTDLDGQLPDFLFDCLSKKDPWINPCSSSRKYLMIFDSQGNFLKETRNQTDNSTYLISRIKRDRKPTEKQIMAMAGHPNYLFQLEENSQKNGSFYIATGSGQLVVAGNEDNSSLLLREDHCGKQSHLISIAISTPAPNMVYDCNQAEWRLWKVDGRFLLVESVDKPGFFINVDSVTHKVRLGEPEMMTGIYTSFLSHVTLDRSSGLQGEPGIGAEAYGDVVLHYFGRNGSQQSGYVCDYEWGQESADTVCKHFGFATGIPTYDGRYSSTNNPEYAVSEFKCESENLDECKMRTICGPSDSCLTQNSMKAFGGKGYACNRGSSTDVAGVVCGDQQQILNVLKQQVSCDRISLGYDRKSVATMHNIQKQIERVSSTMFENKHWSEFLLPMPMAVSLMSALLLVNSQIDRDIELVKPSLGYWDHLKYNNTSDNLLYLSDNITDTFKLSNGNMGDIKVNTQRIKRNMVQALENAFSTNEYDYNTSLPRNLRDISEDAKKNKVKAEQVHNAFVTVNQIINELLQALANTKGYQQNKKVDAEKALNIWNTTYNLDQKEYEKQMLEKQQHDASVKQSRQIFLDAAREAMNSQCVDETLECNTCTWVEPKITGRCKPDKTEKVCVQWDTPICLEWQNFESSTRNCIRRSPNRKCTKWNFPCTDYVHEPEESGNYCQDNGKEGKLCTRCKWVKEILKDENNVMEMTMKLQQSILNGENSYSGVTAVMDELVFQLNIIVEDVQNYKKIKASPRITTSLNNITGGVRNATKLIKLESFDPVVQLIKLLVVMDIDLLNGIKTPIAKKSRMYAFSVKEFLDDLIRMKRKQIGDMTEKETIVVTTLLIQGKAIQQEAKELQAKYDILLEPSADHKIGEQANILLESLTNRHKVEKKIESLSNRVIVAIREIFKHQVEKQDINSIITKLVQCSRYLNLLCEQWIELRTFFNKLSNFLEIMQTSIQEISEFYRDIGMDIQNPQLSQTFKDNLQKEIVYAHVNNIYVEQIAFFYSKISEDGLLQGLDSMEIFLQKYDDPIMLERLKRYIEKKSIMIQEKIKLEISKEEAGLNDKMMKEISSIKNYLVCKLEDAEDLSNKTLIGLKSIVEQDNTYVNILNATTIYSSVDLDEMNFFDDVTFDLNESIEAIENNEIGHINNNDGDVNWLY